MTRASIDNQHSTKASVLPLGEDDPDFVRALARGLAVLECFQDAADGLTLSAVAERTGLTRGSARRLLLTLEFLDYIGANDRRFFLRPRAMRLGQAYLASQPLWSRAQQLLEDLVTQTNHASSLGLLEGGEALYVARAVPKRLIDNDIPVGTKIPAYANSMGKILLAHMSKEDLDNYLRNVTLKKHTPHTISSKTELRRDLAAARERGWSFSDEEVQLGLQALAVPIMNLDGQPVAALNITRYTSTANSDTLEQYVPIVQRTAAEISKLVFWHPQFRFPAARR